jgi:glycosyltransferase involved in cell wall biosynthesis
MLSAIVITKNEEKMIKACLESVKFADEIILADNGSTDKTIEIAKKYTDKIIKYEGQDFSGLRNRAMEEAKGDWVLYVDADERVLEPLKLEILKLVQDDEYSAYAISRTNIIFGQKVDFGPYKKDRMIRLFKKDQFKTWIGKVHETGSFEGKLGYTKNSMLHLTHRDVDSILINKTFEWSRIDAKLRFDSGHPKMSGWRFIRILVTETFYYGIKRKGFWGGTVGVIDTFLSVFSSFLSYVRLWELQQAKPLEKAYEDIDKKLLENGFKY